MNKRLTNLIVAAVLFLGAVLIFRSSAWGTAALWQVSNSGTWLLPLVVVAALLDSINPCAFSILLLTIAFLFSLGRLRGNILRLGLSYIAGIFLVYILIGLGLLQTLHIFNTPHFMAKLGAILLLALGGLNLINYVWPSFPIKLRIPSVAHKSMAALMDKGSLGAVFLLGVLVGICEFPCTGGPYLMVLGLLHDQATYWSGFVYLLGYNLLFVLPLIIILLIASDKSLLDKVQAWKQVETKKMRLWSGLAMVLLGLLILSF